MLINPYINYYEFGNLDRKLRKRIENVVKDLLSVKFFTYSLPDKNISNQMNFKNIIQDSP